MARAPDPRAEQAEKLFREGKKLIEIAEVLEIPEGTVRSWKNRYKWNADSNATLHKHKLNVAKVKGGQPGNQNAVGNRGGAAPEGNKNAVTTGEFETLLFDCLDPDEHRLVQATPADKEQLLLQEIQLLTVRERRMLKRIDNLRQIDFTTVKKKKGIEKDKQTDLDEDHATLGQIQSIEDALTRVQARKQRAIEALHKFGYDDARLELDAKLLSLKMGAQDEDDDEDDGFLDALTATGEEDWRDETSEI